LGRAGFRAHALPCPRRRPDHPGPDRTVRLPQVEQVTPTIGGNDIGFSSIAKDSFVLQPSSGSLCKDKYTAGGADQISQRIQDTAPKVAAVLQGIKTRAPRSTPTS
jgi:hypothetical protein